MPDLPWPLHAAHLNLPVTVAVAHAARPGTAGGDGFDALARPAVERLRSSRPRELAQALDRFAHDRLPAFDILHALDLCLRVEAPDLHGRLQDHVRHATALVSRAARGVEKLAPASGRGFAAATLLVGESCRGDAATGGAAGDFTTDRYFGALDCLLERTIDVVSRLGGAHSVRLRVLTRDVWDPARRQWRPLDVDHVRAAIARLPASAGAVQLCVDGVPPRYTRDVESPLVLADFLANRGRWFLRRRASLARVEARLASSGAVRVRSGRPPLSHLAATGWAQTHVRAAREAPGKRGPLPPLPRRIKRWAREQAEEWAREVRRPS
jgi:hypothetical protein